MMDTTREELGTRYLVMSSTRTLVRCCVSFSFLFSLVNILEHTHTPKTTRREQHLGCPYGVLSTGQEASEKKGDGGTKPIDAQSTTLGLTGLMILLLLHMNGV